MSRLLSAIAVGILLCTSVSAAERPRVVTVNYPLHYIAERLLGDNGEVVFPVPDNTDPSFWRPSIADISMIQSADLILLNGAGFATWIDRVSLPRSRLVNTSAGIRDQFIVTESITHSHGDGGEHSHDAVASYTWLDPTLAIAQAEAVAAALASRNLAPAEDVYARFDDLRREWEALDAQAATELAPAQDVPMIATHPRYQYLARRYGLSITALEWDAGAMPGPDDLSNLKALVAETDARVLIWEAEPPAVALDAAETLGLKNVVFNPLARNTAETSFTTALQTAITSLAAAAARAPSN